MGKNNKTVKILLVGVVVLTLVTTIGIGCKATTTTTGAETTAVTTAAEITTAAETTAKEVSSEGETLNFLTWWSLTPEMIALFKKQTGITLNYEPLASEYSNEILRTRIIGGADLDVISIKGEMRRELFNDDVMVDLTGQPVLERVNDLSAGTAANGKVYGIPIGSFTEVVWYNKDIFAKNNLSVPKNWVEFNDVCKKLKEAGITPIVEGFKDNWPYWYAGVGPLQRIYENDPTIAEKLYSGEVKWTDPIWLDALKEVESFVHKGYFAPESTGLAYMNSMQVFNDGKAAMTLSGTWDANKETLGKDLRIGGFNLGAFSIPYNLPGEELKGDRVEGVVTGISKKSIHKETGIKFLEWITDPNGGAPILHNTNGTPSNFKGFETDLGEFTEVIREAQGLPGQLSIQENMYPGVYTLLHTVISEMLIGTKTAEEGAKELQAAQDTAIAEGK